MPRTANVTLAGKEYVIGELSSRLNAEWRANLAGPFADLAALLTGWQDIEINIGGVGALIQRIQTLFLGSADLLVGLLFDYSVELAADRERIQDASYDSEIMQAFLEVLTLAYPFGSLMQKLAPLLGSGSPKHRTGPSLRSPSGDGGTTSSTTKRKRHSSPAT